MTGKSYHRLLERQLKKFLPGYPEVPEHWDALLQAISNSYEHSDNDRLLMETAMRESSDELITKREALNELFDQQSHVLEALKEAVAALFPDRKSMDNEDLLQLADLVEEEIGKRRIAETQKAQSDQRLLDIIESLHLGLGRYNLQGQLTHVERRFAEIFSMNPEEMVGMSAQDLPSLSRSSDESGESRTIEFFLSNQVFESSFRCSKTGNEFWLLCTTAPLLDETGKAEGGVIVVFDITSRKKLENEMQDARRAAESGLELRKSILANVSHELRTPVNAIVGMSALLSATPLSEQQKEYVKTMRFSSDGLLVLIDDLLDVSRIEAGKVELEEIEFSLRENFTELTKELKNRAADKGLFFEWNIDDRVAQRHCLDVHRLNQVVSNLINNAIKFTQQGSVRLDIEYMNDVDGKQEMRFSVSDTGIGIAAERQAAIFQAFTQEDSSTTRKYGGSGLGLSISKKIVELMGSSLELRSEKNVGSTFSFKLLLKKAAAEKKEVAAFNPDLKGSRILLVEDNKVNQFLANALLKTWNAQVDISEDGLDAVERMKNEKYDLVLMDLQMPIMDGFEATDQIRNQLKLDLPVVGLSANALNDERERSLDAGMNDYVSKPFQPELLYSKIHALIFRS